MGDGQMSDDDLHYAMNVAVSEVVTALECRGFSPCDAIKHGHWAMAKAWDVWNLQAAEIESLLATVEWLNRADRPDLHSFAPAGKPRYWWVDGVEGSFDSVEAAVKAAMGANP